ncbi:MAG: branched-chain amino acid ABC transporter permease [Spirochaetales bacterium]|uniref:Branched-chain amino acid ABC transporter permease n=1 Tax=Candidatus Thalassospirochaeta sargassi TaxID=3119039 RepID=A0AAJ1ID29_9SPIO|nr:branched-chain amino acid ABC transporter permease [Spirochaetales bacterium]
MSLPLYYYLAITAIYILMSWSIYIPYRVGQLHFMTVANMAISSYFAALMAINFAWPFWLVLIVGTLLGALIGFLVSVAIGDAPCFAVVIVGFTFIYLTKTIIENVEAFGGPLGIFSIPKVLQTSSDNRTLLLIVAYALVLLTGFLISRFDHSRLGRAASAIFIDRDLAVSFGVDVKKLGMFLQTWASAVGGMSGVMYAFIMRSISPNHFTFHLIGVCMTMLFVGGYTTLWGALLAAPILWGFPLILPEALQSWNIVIYGVLLIVVLVIKPEGIITRPTVKKIESLLSRNRKKV